MDCPKDPICLLKLNNVQEAFIEKRPSATCKTPYVADIIINGEKIMGHSPSLGCCGIAEKGRYVYTCPIESLKKTSVCSHRIELGTYEEPGRGRVIIGINPKMGETIAQKALENNLIADLQNVQSWEREKKFLNSRFDFAGIDESGRPFIMEIKNVPLADYVDVPKKEREEALAALTLLPDFHKKIAYFPDGYRKKSTDVVSPRALKHIQELETISMTTDTRTILCFIIQRDDACCFQPSNIDLTYKEAVIKAHQNGVEIKTLQVSWKEDGSCYFVRNDLPINLS
jgi:DNA-binding sugar fermentation-stimulating protein